MEINVMLIAPYKGLIELTASLKEQLHGFRIRMEHGNLSEALPLIQSMRDGEYDLIISRGGTAKLLRQHTDIPVIEVHVTGYDIMRILTLVKDNRAKVEMIGFPNVIEGFISVSRIMNIDIPYTVIEHEDEVDRAISKAKDGGASIVLGDTITALKAQQYGLQGVLITSGKEAVLEAFAQARYMQALVWRHRQKTLMYQKLMDLQDAGFAVIDGQKRVHYANSLFYSHWDLPRTLGANGEAVLRSPTIAALTGCLEKGMLFEGNVGVLEAARPFVINAGPIPLEAGEGLYFLKTEIRPLEEMELKVRFSGEDMKFIPLSFASAQAPDESKALHIDSRFPTGVYGESGSGKRLWAERLIHVQSCECSIFIEIEIAKMSDNSFAALRNMIVSSDENMVVLLKGVEFASIAYQKQIAVLIGKAGGKWILSFERDPGKLAKEGRLDSGLFEMIKDRLIYFPPLRERKADFEMLIRSFIAKSNEKLGKQVVGLRPRVLEGLRQHPWHGNLVEFKETIEMFVREAAGEYIEEHVLERLGRVLLPSDARHGAQGVSGGINLNRTLEHIERDIIMAVLQEEQMNQSQAAKRLGINRSTLWRKLKQDQEIE
jgi:propionate catabolism operon transcriptional regulator